MLYVSPLKALAVDVERNLRAPLAGIANLARGARRAVRVPAVAVRTGDTPARERARFQREPADILITTPESLYLLLTSHARETLRVVETVIVDEIHALVPTKRGAHLALSLERLEALVRHAAAAHRPLGDAAAARRGGAVPRRRRGTARRRAARRAAHGPAARRDRRRGRCARDVRDRCTTSSHGADAPSHGGR